MDRGGGYVRVQQKDERGQLDRLRRAGLRNAVCWVDRSTLGYFLDSRRNGTEADVATLLTALRADAEVGRNP